MAPVTEVAFLAGTGFDASSICRPWPFSAEHAHGASTSGSSLCAKTGTDPGHSSDLKQSKLTGKAQGNEAQQNLVSICLYFLSVLSLTWLYFASTGDGS